MPRFLTHYWQLFALLTGALFTLSFAPFNYHYLAPLALSLLFYSWQNTPPLRVFLIGYCFGIGSFGLGISWVYISVHDFGGANSFNASLITLLCVLFWGVFPALAGYISAKTQLNKSQKLSYIALPIIWMLIEYCRGELILNGFPWLQIAYAQLDTPLAGYIPVLGAYGTGLISTLMATGLIGIFQQPRYQIVLMALLLTILSIGATLKTIQWTQPNGAPIKVSLLQGNLSQDQKWLPENKTKTLLWYKATTEAHWDSELIIWPETAIPAYLSEVNDWFIQPLSKQAEQHQSTVVVSLPIKNAAINEKYNAVMTLGKDAGLYKKRHLLPFGEYLPLQPLSGFILNSLAIKLGDFNAGDKNQTLLKAAGHPFITTICYEDAFGALGLVNIDQAAFLINLTNDAWFGNSIEPYQHLQLARMRALETGRFLLRATNTGITAIIDFKGHVVQQAALFEPATLTDSITPMKGLTPYAHIGDRPILILLVTVFFILIRLSRLTPFNNPTDAL